MNKVFLTVLACAMTVPAMAQNAAVAPAATPAVAPAAAPAVAPVKDTSGLTEDQKALYFLGQAVSTKIKQFNFTPDETTTIIKGFSESLSGTSLALDEKVYGAKLNDLLKAKQEVVLNKEKENGKAFLEKMSKETGAQKLASGMLYIPESEGTGAIPKATDMVKVHYHGTFADGKVFDSSIDRGTPAEFPLSGVIPCWTEGVQKMKVGGKAKLVCPSETAYGDQGAGGAIPGGATLMFEVQLLEIMKQPAAAPVAAKPAAKPAAKKAAAKKPAAKPAAAAPAAN